MNVLITANSPGELYGWARPLATRLKNISGCNIILVLLPCVFSSGEEKRVALKMPFIDKVVTVREYLEFIILGKRLKAFSLYPPQIIVHLGGDLFHAALMARRFSIPAVGYKWAVKKYDRYFVKYFVPHKKFKDIMLKEGIKEDKIEITGEFVVDEVVDEIKREKNHVLPVSGEPVICCMPGSRFNEISALMGFFMRIAELIKKEIPSAFFIFPLSPFISMEVFLKILSSPLARGFVSTKAKLIEEYNIKYLETQEEVKILLYLDGGVGAMAKSDFLLTIPGTKCLEGAVMGKPMLVVTPLNRPDLIAFHGFLGLLDLIPGGSYVKGRLLLHVAKKFGFIALPNILAEREIVPELTGVLTPEDVSKYVLKLLSDKDLLHVMSENLKLLYKPGASDRAVKLIKDIYEDYKN
ncbi:MAG TPA: hypothetical protein PL110_02585 [Candidatus Eremiobacteraeota bacterium]|nr:hypothetical protein [Candidatus Eremiobacteraeota bacterium]